MNLKSDMFDATILLSSYRRSKLLDFGLRSISCQDLKGKTLEVIVLNDGPHDDTIDICREHLDKLNIKYIHTGGHSEWRCPGFAFNIGAKHASGRVLFLSCAEMYHLNDDISKMVDLVESDERAIVITRGFDDDRRILNALENGSALPDFQSCPALNVQLPFFMAIATKSYIEIGGYDEDFTGIGYDDNDFVDRLLAGGFSYKKTDDTVIHLYHSRFTSTDYNGSNNRVNHNRNLYNSRKGVIKRNNDKEWGVKKMNIKLSILIPSVPARRGTYQQKILDQLEGQLEKNGRQDVEILVLYDNKKRKVGEKRQDLLNLARGEFLVFIDDDDRVSDNYIDKILQKIDEDKSIDCIVFDTLYSRMGGSKMLCKYGVEYEYNHASPEQNRVWTGKPAHTMVYKSSLAKSVVYKSVNFGEDVDWVIRASKLIKKQSRIDEVLYFYENDYTQINHESDTKFVNGEIVNK